MLWCRTLLLEFKRWTIILLLQIKRNLLFASFHWQFFAHPVMYNLMRKKWFGPFGKMKRSSWLEVGRWKWLFLNIWCLFDIVLFPFLFTLFYIKHRINKVTRRSKGNIFWLAICKGNPALLSTIFFLFFFLVYQILQHSGAIIFPRLKELLWVTHYSSSYRPFCKPLGTIVHFVPPPSSGCFEVCCWKKCYIFHCKVVLNQCFTLFLILSGAKIKFKSNNTLLSGFYQRYHAIDIWNAISTAMVSKKLRERVK